MIELPAELDREPGTTAATTARINHDVKAVYQKYLGWFDGNPANLHPLPPVEAGQAYVEFMGGAEAVLAKAREAYDARRVPLGGRSW